VIACHHPAAFATCPQNLYGVRHMPVTHCLFAEDLIGK
jgi:hypothetical protein